MAAAKQAKRAGDDGLEMGAWLEKVQFLSDSMESTSQPFAAGYPDGCIFLCNDAFCDLTGYSKEEIIGSVTLSKALTPPEWREHEAAELRELHRTGMPRRYEKEYVRKDGSRIPVEILVHEARNTEGDTLFYYSLATDISKRKRVEEDLKKYRIMLENVRDIVYFIRLDGSIIEVNDAAVKAYGYTREELYSMNIADLRVPGERPGMLDLLNRCYKAGCLFETVHQRRDGSAFPVEINSRGIELKGEKALIGIGRDITERRRLEQSIADRNTELSHAVETLETTINTIHVGVVVAEAGSERILYYSPRAEEIVGVPVLGSATGPVPGRARSVTMLRPDGSVIPPEEWPLARALRRGQATINEEIIIRCVNGKETTTLMNCTPVLDAEGKIISAVASIVDITGRKRNEEELKAARDQAELYVDLMAHDINNLNQTASGYLELALDALDVDGKIGPDGRILIEKPLRAIHGSSMLIDNVRKLQRLLTESVKARPIDLHDLFEEVKARDFHDGEREVSLRFGEVPHCIAEGSELLRDVFYNLIHNAVKHSLPDSPVTISVRVDRVTGEGRAYCRCVVEDDGPGIPDDLKPRLFHRFQRGRTKAHGKGLGLYIVRTLVEGYHGKVWVEDRVPGDHKQGARFVVMLPALDNRPETTGGAFKE